jgi:ribonuclease D
MKGLIATDPIWVKDDTALNELCQRWSNQAAIAIDTEFVRTDTFFPIAALFQVGDGTGCYLIDPLAIKDFASFKTLLVNPRVTKVMHSCSEDMEVFAHLFDLTPIPIFDTQVAAALAGYDFSMGYARLIERLLDISLAKDQTRSDWLCRPLSSSQLRYAALDVAYLLVAYGMLQKRLGELGRSDWIIQDCAEIVAVANRDVDPDSFYLKIKSAWKLNRKQLACLQLLAAWRECEARDQNIPRNRLIKEHAIFDMAKLGPTEINHLRKIEGLPPRVIHSYGDELLDIVEQAYHLPDDVCPPLIDKPVSAGVGALVKQIKSILAQTAEEQSLPVEMLLRKKDVELMARGVCLQQKVEYPERLTGWREDLLKELIEPVLIAAL